MPRTSLDRLTALLFPRLAMRALAPMACGLAVFLSMLAPVQASAAEQKVLAVAACDGYGDLKKQLTWLCLPWRGGFHATPPEVRAHEHGDVMDDLIRAQVGGAREHPPWAVVRLPIDPAIRAPEPLRVHPRVAANVVQFLVHTREGHLCLPSFLEL